VVNVLLSLALLPHVGLIGAAIAWAAAIVANNLLPLLQLAVAYHLHPFGRGTLLAMGSALGWLGLVPLLAGLASGGSLPVLLVSAFALLFGGSSDDTAGDNPGAASVPPTVAASNGAFGRLDRGPQPPVTGAWTGAWVRPALPTQAGLVAGVSAFEAAVGRRL